MRIPSSFELIDLRAGQRADVAFEIAARKGHTPFECVLSDSQGTPIQHLRFPVLSLSFVKSNDLLKSHRK